ncbi:MAG TPA: hypothetical protein DHV62_08025 [Elusimicrobia bacterium]|jgi:alcohol dehydrogenase class IV|nr:hypothetical protein [Elusimicrobiota bacterium]
MYEFNLPTRIIFGTGTLNQLGKEAKKFGSNIFLVTGRKALRESGTLEKVEKIFTDEGLGYFLYDRVNPEPDVETVDETVRLCQKNDADLVVGIGGGSAIDVAKAVAGLSRIENFTTVADYLEEVRAEGEEMKTLTGEGLPFLAVPTTSGSGAEVTLNAVIVNKKLKTKRSFRSAYLFAKVAIIDPELTVYLSPPITASSGMDALTHLLEGYLSKKANPFTDTLAIVGIKLVKQVIPEAVRNGHNLDARTTMAQASLFGGIVIANAGLGLIHGLGSFLGSLHHLPHGLACAVVLPAVLEYNLESSPERKGVLAYVLEGEPVEVVRNLMKEINLPERLSDLGIKENDLKELAEKSLTASSTKNNPREVNYEEVLNLLKKTL